MNLFEKFNQLRQRFFNKNADEATSAESYGLREELDKLIKELNEFKNAPHCVVTPKASYRKES